VLAAGKIEKKRSIIRRRERCASAGGKLADNATSKAPKSQKLLSEARGPANGERKKGKKILVLQVNTRLEKGG